MASVECPRESFPLRFVIYHENTLHINHIHHKHIYHSTHSSKTRTHDMCRVCWFCSHCIHSRLRTHTTNSFPPGGCGAEVDDAVGVQERQAPDHVPCVLHRSQAARQALVSHSLAEKGGGSLPSPPSCKHSQRLRGIHPGHVPSVRHRSQSAGLDWVTLDDGRCWALPVTFRNVWNGSDYKKLQNTKKPTDFESFGKNIAGTLVCGKLTVIK